jgi:hypothetical protein
MTNEQRSEIIEHIADAKAICKGTLRRLCRHDAPDDVQLQFLGTLDACDRAIKALPAPLIPSAAEIMMGAKIA